MRFFCFTHQKDFSSEAAPRVYCDIGPHDLGRDFPRSPWWEQCAHCGTVWIGKTSPCYQPTNNCPFCAQFLNARYLCDHCNTLTLYAPKSAPSDEQHCGACLTTSSETTSHHCSLIGTEFLTARRRCPFCDERIAFPPSFPAFVNDFLERIKSTDQIAVGLDLLQIDDSVVVPDPQGEFIVVSNGSRNRRSILLPRETRIEQFGDQRNFSPFYDSEGRGLGDIKILSPATVKKIKGGWVLTERGRLSVEVESAKLSSQSAFPKTAADYLNQFNEKVVIKFNQSQDCFVRDRSNQGAIVIVGNEEGDYALPRLTQFAGEQGFQQYFKSYYEPFFDCIRAGAGDVWIHSPSIVRKHKDGWIIFEKGVLEIRANVQSTEIPNASSEQTQSNIGAATVEEQSRPSPLNVVVVPNQPVESEAEPDDPTTVAEPRPNEEGLIPGIKKPATENNDRRWIIAAFVVALLIILGVSLWSLTRPSHPPTGNANAGPATTASPENMVRVSGGKFTMGNDLGDDYEKPAHEVKVGSFFLDKYEVTCEQYARFVKDKKYPAPALWKNGNFPAGWARRPVTGVTWDDANAYAHWAGKRLPTEEEWEFAARGTTGWRYPWGNEWMSEAANTGSTSSHQLADVGEYSKGASPFGALDMVGNAWEWTASKLIAYPGGRIPKQPNGLMVIRGGSWQDRQGQATTTYRGYLPATSGKDYSATGFRCVKDVSAEN